LQRAAVCPSVKSNGILWQGAAVFPSFKSNGILTRSCSMPS
jgi:hypothetical protein